MSAEKHSIRNSIVATVIGGLILAVILRFVPSAWAWVISTVTGLFNFLISNIEIPAWIVVATTCAVVPTLVSISRFVLGSGRKAGNPGWARYTEDHFDGMTWHWAYLFSDIVDLWCYCPDDDTVLVCALANFTDQITFRCETCGRKFGPFDGDKDYILAKMKRQIDRKIRKGEWKTSLS